MGEWLQARSGADREEFLPGPPGSCRVTRPQEDDMKTKFPLFSILAAGFLALSLFTAFAREPVSGLPVARRSSGPMWEPPTESCR